MNGNTIPFKVRFLSKIVKTNTCWKWIGAKDSKGYGRIGSGGRKGKQLGAHRVSYEFHKGEIPKEMFVLHKCDVPDCVNPDHLFLGTQFDNMRDCVKKGRLNPFHPNGEKAYNAVLTWEKVDEIRSSKDRSYGYQTRLAKKYGVKVQVIFRVINNLNWTKH